MLHEVSEIITHEWQRPSLDIMKGFSGAATGHIADAFDGYAALNFKLKAIIPEQANFLGIALTCQTGPADNLALLHALTHAQPWDILVVDTQGYTNCAVAGDLVLGMAKNSGVKGFVTDGCVRDIAGIRKLNMPVWAMGVTPNSPHRRGPGHVGGPVTLLGSTIRSGDILLADEDGVVVIPANRAAEILKKVHEIAQAEQIVEAKVHAGMTRPEFLQQR